MAPKMPDQILGRQAAELVLRQTERNHRAVLRSQSGIGEFLEEGNVGVAVQRADIAGRAASREFFDLRNDGLIVRVPESRVDLDNAGVRNTLGLEIYQENLVGETLAN